MFESFPVPEELSVFDWSAVALAVALSVVVICGVSIWRDNA